MIQVIKNKKIFLCLVLVLISLLTVFNSVVCYAATEPSVGRVRLNIETYLAGQNQPTHPAVVSFDKEWNGFKYWMVYTPYPNSNGEEENPSIAVSNDLYKWETPYGMVNPIADTEETGCTELKDAHILYRDDLDRLEVWYLGRVSENLGGDGSSLTLFRKVSYDGITWSKYEIISTHNYVSPTVSWNGSKYQLWSIGFSNLKTGGTFVYQESEDGKEWTSPVQCSIEGKSSDLQLWHGAVTYDPSAQKYIFVYISRSGISQTIESCESDDGIHFSQVQSVVKNDENTLWDHFYRPCLLIDSETGDYHLFYGVVTEEGKWFISCSHGDSLSELKGITEADQKKMVPLDDVVVNIKTPYQIVKDFYNNIRSCIKPEILVISLIFAVIHKLIIKKNRLIDLLICLTSVILCCLFSYVFFRPDTIQILFPVITAGIIEGLCVHGIGIAIYQFIWNPKEQKNN